MQAWIRVIILALVLLLCIPKRSIRDYASIFCESSGSSPITNLTQEEDQTKNPVVVQPESSVNGDPTGGGEIKTVKKTLAWVLHFTYTPKRRVLNFLFHSYAKHFALIIIVSPTSRPRRYLPTPPNIGTQLLWTPPCNNSDQEGRKGGAMMRCYAFGLQMLTIHPAFHGIDSVLLSNDDLLLNMTKIKELAANGRPTVHLSPSENPPPIFTLPTPNATYFEGWDQGGTWGACQKVFAEVPPDFKKRFRRRHGQSALKGGADIFLLPTVSVPEFIFLASIVSDCWLEISIINALAMLSLPVTFDTDPPVFLYNWDWETRPVGNEIVNYLSGKEFASYHPFKFSHRQNREAFSNLSKLYNLN